ncbi:MAG: tRNA(Ile2) 2-agmatinylcytidine synthetase [Methanomicrobiales archaeon]
MIVRTPAELRKQFGPLFSRRFLVMVDDTAGLAEIFEECHARGTIEWDAANRMRAGGSLLSCRVEGTAMTMTARTGRHPVQFGAADRDIGGQALEGVEIDGENVITSWSGIAGAGVGIAACLPQAPGVIRAEYPEEADLVVGGSRVNRVRIVSPRYEKVTIGIDDTDTREEGATWVTALSCAESCPVEGVELLNMRLVQLNPAVPRKTTNCVGSALNFAVLPRSVDPLLSYIREFIEAESVSDDTGIAVFQGIALPHDSDFPRRVKTELATLEETEEEAARQGIRFIDQNGRKGRIGALGSVFWANSGPEAAGLYGETL